NAVLAALPAPYATRTVDAARRMLAREHFENTLASRLAAPVTEAATQANQLGAIGIGVTRYQLQADARFNVPYEGDNAS
ncbi:esterase-like activity of phytase family protein, partial [Variovorax sp. 2RAF20]